MSDEVELKFDVEPACAEWLRAAPPLAGAEARVHQSESIYFDTPDQALRRAGVSLRVRRSGDRIVQTVKRKKGNAAGLFVREEWEAELGRFDLDPGAFADAAARRLLARFDRAALAPIIRTAFTRTAWEVVHDGSRIEVVLDEGKVSAGGHSAPLTELELELVEGERAALFGLARQIGGTAPLWLGVRSKNDRGYALLEGSLAKPAKADPVLLGAEDSRADAFRKTALSCLRHYRLNEFALSFARDPDALHQARVALRRLRSALSLFRPAVKGGDYDALREELRWYAGQFGDARNLDVLLAGELISNDRPLRKLLAAERERAYDHVLTTIRSDRGRALMLRLAAWIEIGEWTHKRRSGGKVGELAQRRLERQWRRVSGRGAELAKLDADAAHQLRIDIKKLRYASEFLASLYPGKAQANQSRHFIAALKDLQERLGVANDARVARELVARLSPGREEEIAIPVVATEEAENAYRQAAAAAGYWLPAAREEAA